MLETALFALLSQKESLQALLGTSPFRFFPDVPPENNAWPCARYQVISQMPTYLLSGQNVMETTRIQIDGLSGGASGAQYLAARQVVIAIRKIIEGFRGELPAAAGFPAVNVAWVEVVGARDLYTQDSRAFGYSMDFMFHRYP